MRKSTRFFAVVFTLIGLLWTSMFAKEVKCFVLLPPEQMLIGVKQIAVMDFQTVGNSPVANGGGVAADYMVAALLLKDRGIGTVTGGFLGMSKKQGKTYQKGVATNIYSLVERSRIQQVISEQQLSTTGLVDESQVVNIGKLLGVDAVITGTVEVLKSEGAYQEKRIDYETKQQFLVNCFKRQAKAKISMRLIAVENGQILGQKSIENLQESAKCEPKLNEVLDHAVLGDWAIKNSAEQLVSYFAPAFGLQEIELKEVKAKEYKDKSKQALQKLDDDDLQNAFATFAWISEQDPYLHEAVYMKGVLFELIGDYKNATEQYEIALSVKEDEKDYKNALKRAKTQQSLWEGLNAMGIFLEQQEFSTSAEDLAKAQQKKIKVKGGSGDKVPVYSESNATSIIISSIPGGVTLDYIDTIGDFYKVRLINKKEGYVEAKKAEEPK